MILRSAELSGERVTLVRPELPPTLPASSTNAEATLPVSQQSIDPEQVALGLASLTSQERARILAQFDVDIRAIRESAAAEGRLAAAAQARKLDEQEREHRSRVIAAALESLKITLDRNYEALHGQCAEIVAELLARLAGGFLSSGAALASATKTAAELLPSTAQLHIRVHPDDVAVVLDLKDQIEARQVGRSVTVTGDPMIEYGGCVVESGGGVIDARWDTQLQRVLDSLAHYRSGEES